MVACHLTLVLLILQITQACHFPEFLQRFGQNETKRDWHTHLTYHGRENLMHYALATYFDRDRMRVLVYGGQKAKNRPKNLTRHCLFQYTATRYLSSHIEDGSQAKKKYVCQEFIQRSTWVFQLVESEFTDTEDLNLCNDDRMSLVNWIYVDKGNIYKTFGECPLSGGFSMFMYDEEQEKGICDSYKEETRMEVQCEEGEGLKFLFRTADCVPKHLRMQVTQPTYCIASWQHGTNMFSILRHHDTDNMWCFRFPVTNRRQFRAYLFKNVYCDVQDLPEEKAMVTMDMERDSVKTMEDLCMDDYEACQYWEPCTGLASHTELTCAKTCKVCDTHTRNKRPDRCKLPNNFHGLWADREDHMVSITNVGLTVSKKSHMHCIDWQRRHMGDGVEYLEQMFVRTYENGCRPRYNCIQLKKQSPSVLRFKVSEGQIWPFEGINSRTIDCGSFQYEDTLDPFTDTYHSQYFNTLISQLDMVYVNCELEPRRRKFEVIFEDRQKCTGVLTQEGLENDRKMKLNLNKCEGRQSEQEFACLDSTKHIPYSQHLIVTETLDFQSSRIQCWLFPSSPGNLFYLLQLSDCNEVAYERINRGLIKPKATFSDRNEISISIDVDYSMLDTTKKEGYGKLTNGGKSTSYRVTDVHHVGRDTGAPKNEGSLHEGGVTHLHKNTAGQIEVSVLLVGTLLSVYRLHFILWL